MRSAGNFNSEWGYLAPAPSFMRTARVVLVATAIGATAGAAVVLSLIDRPAAERDKTASITAHAIVTSAQAAPATAIPAPSSATAALAAPVKRDNGRSADGRANGASAAVPARCRRRRRSPPQVTPQPPPSSPQRQSLTAAAHAATPVGGDCRRRRQRGAINPSARKAPP